MGEVVVLEAIDQDAIEIGELYARARDGIIGSVFCSIECGKRLAQKKDELPHGQWLPWLEANKETLGFASRATAARLIKVGSNVSLTLHLDEARAMQISREIWGNEGVYPISLSTGHAEWFTPDEVLSAVRVTFGGTIDLDPASCPEAQARVRATMFFDEAANGLEREWDGKVFLNPPYNAPLVRAFVDKLVFEFESGRVSQAILLANDQTDATWFYQAARAARLFFFFNKRLDFYQQDRDKKGSHVCNSTLFYFGDDPTTFQKAFFNMGYFCELVR